MIFYLAILLTLCGFLIVISALFIEISEAKATDEYSPIQTAKPTSHGNFKSDNLEIISPDELDNRDNIFSEFEDTLPDLFGVEHTLKRDNFDIENEFYDNIDRKTENIKSSEAELSMESDIYDMESNPARQRGDDDVVYAIMFDDRSDIIDYTSGVGTIDSSLLKYKDIKRIGRGIIESDPDGINFYLDEKLYRFDSHRIYDIWCGENYVALPLKGNGIVKLFIIENSEDFPHKVETNFKEFESGLSSP